MEFKHVSVLYNETIFYLSPEPDTIFVDGTLGGGGHTSGLLAAGATVIGIDRDQEAIDAASARLSEYGDKFTAVKGSFSEVCEILDSLGIAEIDGAVLDLGVSSYQLDNAERGFSYMHDARLDMRMDQSAPLDAYTVVNTYDKDELTRIFYEYGEEKWSKRIAEFITEKREIKPIETTLELVDIIKAAVPAAARRGEGHPAKRVFQAIRIEVNGELRILKQALKDFTARLTKGGRLAVITFHSLEDRIVKQTFQELSTGCTCPKSFPVCVCGKTPAVRIITRKPVLPSEEELSENPRSKSAKLRVIEKI